MRQVQIRCRGRLWCLRKRIFLEQAIADFVCSAGMNRDSETSPSIIVIKTILVILFNRITLALVDLRIIGPNSNKIQWVKMDWIAWKWHKLNLRFHFNTISPYFKYLPCCFNEFQQIAWSRIATVIFFFRRPIYCLICSTEYILDPKNTGTPTKTSQSLGLFRLIPNKT
jgi:hypothetical protein